MAEQRSFPTQAQVVVIGGGVIGCSVAYHLTKLGWRDVVLLERKDLTCGTTWHAAGLIVSGTFTSAVMSDMSKYTRELFQRLGEETGQDAGFDPAEDIEGIAINRWGHAEVICYPGFAFGSGNSDEPKPGVPIYDAGQRFGRIAFAHTDLNGFADNQGTTRISRRAVDDLLD
jgi:hypothetical protein